MTTANAKRGRKGADLPIYWRHGIAYLDARRWGKGRLSLRVEGEVCGTTDPVVAEFLALELVNRWEQEKTMAARLGLRPGADFAEIGDRYLQRLRERGKSDSHVRYMQCCLLRALDFFDVVQAEQATTAAERKRTRRPRSLGTISVPDVRAFMHWLQSLDIGRGRPMSDNTVRFHLAALSGVFAQAISDEQLQKGGNPVKARPERPSAAKPYRKTYSVAVPEGPCPSLQCPKKKRTKPLGGCMETIPRCWRVR